MYVCDNDDCRVYLGMFLYVLIFIVILTFALYTVHVYSYTCIYIISILMFIFIATYVIYMYIFTHGYVVVCTYMNNL